MRRLLTLVCSAALLAPAPGFSQARDVTTVDDLVSVGLAPVPNVGRPAPLISVEQLEQAVAKADADFTEARMSVASCRGGDLGELTAPPDEYTAQWFYEQERQAQRAFLAAAEAATEASKLALAARAAAAAAAGDGSAGEVEATELARQRAILAFLDAQYDARDARARIADMIQFKALYERESGGANWASQWPIPSSDELPRLIEFISRAGSFRTALGGIAGIAPATEFEDLRLSNVKVVETQTPRLGKVIRISGAVTNTRARTINMPPLLIALIGPEGQQVGARAVTPDRTARIRPDQTTPFQIDYTPPPENSVRALVTFGTQATVKYSYMPTGGACDMSQDRVPPPGAEWGAGLDTVVAPVPATPRTVADTGNRREREYKETMGLTGATTAPTF